MSKKLENNSTSIGRIINLLYRYLMIASFITIIAVDLHSELNANNIVREPNSQLNVFQEDFNYFYRILLDSHPGIETDNTSFNQKVEAFMECLATVTDTLQFEARLRAFTHDLHDGHTRVSSFSNQGSPIYPIGLWWHESGWYVEMISTEFKDLIGSKVISINGIDAETFMTKLMQLTTGENVYWLRDQVSFFLRNSANLRALNLDRPDGVLQLIIKQNGTFSEVNLYEVERPSLWGNQKTGITALHDDNYWGQALPEDNVYYIQFNAMSDPVGTSDTPFSGWISFLKESFALIDSLGIDNLVIDLRNNSGGNSTMGDILLSFCSLPDSIYYFGGKMKISDLVLNHYQMNLTSMNKALSSDLGYEVLETELPFTVIFYDGKSPFLRPRTLSEIVPNVMSNDSIKKYNGKLILLTGSQTYSSAVMFATLCQDNGLAIVYGSPTGGKPSSYGEGLNFRLPNTGIMCSVSVKYFQRPDTSRDPSDSLYPDVDVLITPEEYFSPIDTLWERVLNDIRNSDLYK